MTRTRAVLWLVLFSLAIPFLLLQFARWQAAAFAAESTAEATASQFTREAEISVVADTTTGMQPELDLLAEAWEEGPWTPLTATYHLVAFKDSAVYLGNTNDPAQFANALKNLNAEGGEGCPNGAVAGLIQAARNLPVGQTPDSNVLLVTDGTPRTNRQQIAYLIDRLLARGVRVHSLVSGWCLGAPLPEEALAYLSLATGGFDHKSVAITTYMTETLIAQSLMAAEDRIFSRVGVVSQDQPQEFPLAFDGTISTLGVDDEEPLPDPNENCPPWCCLTCVVRSLSTVPTLNADSGNVTVELIDPDGQVVGEGTQGYTHLSTGNNQLQILKPLDPDDIPSGIWTLRVSGTGEYALDVVANSSLHLAYLGRYGLSLNRDTLFRAALIDESGLGINTANFRLVSLDGQQSYPIDLFDDGAHSDGVAGDGIYGGEVTPSRPGLWRLLARGFLGDGSPFVRLDPTPIRVMRFRMADQPSAVALPGGALTPTFELINDQATAGDAAAPENGPITFDLAVFSEQGWAITDTLPVSVTLDPGESIQLEVPLKIPNGAPRGTLEEITLVAVPLGDLGSAVSAMAQTTVGWQTYLPVVIRQP